MTVDLKADGGILCSLIDNRVQIRLVSVMNQLKETKMTSK